MIPSLCASLAVYNGFFRFTFGATHADLLVASMVAMPFQSNILAPGMGPGFCQDEGPARETESC